MINAEKYKEDIMAVIRQIYWGQCAVTDNGVLACETVEDCTECKFRHNDLESCEKQLIRWMLQDVEV